MYTDIFKGLIKKKLSAPWGKYYNDSDMDIKLKNISLYEQIRRTSIKYPNEKAYSYLGKEVKYKKFIKQIDKASISFKVMGIKKGDIVTICMPNTPEAIIAFYALNRIGAIANMLHPLSSEEEIKLSLLNTNSKLLIIIDMNYTKINSIIKSTKVKKVILVSASDSMKPYMKIAYKIMNITKSKNTLFKNKYMHWNSFINLSLFKDKFIVSPYGKNTPAVILSSGGTSGKPKNVVIQNRAFLLITEQERIIMANMNIGDSCLAIMPNFHGFGLAVSMHSQFALGYKVILVPKFDSTKFDILLKQTQPAMVLGVPTLFEALVSSKNVSDLDLSCLKYMISGGDMLTKNLEDRINEYLSSHNSNIKISQGYGLTEALSAVCLGFRDINKSGSIGIPLPGNYVKIINPSTRKEEPFNVIGEIVIHNKALMMGYLNNESETNDALQKHDDGYIWLHTGDLGYMDKDGFIYYKGRQKRMIITSGYNVYPSYVEDIIESHPAVLQCTVVGQPHPYKQEVPKAFIVLKEGFHGLFIKSEIKEYCKKNLSKYMVPYKFVYRKKLPTTKLGKVDFKVLQSDIGEDDDE